MTLPRLQWFGAVLLCGFFYGFIGVVFALPSNHVRLWRLAAWMTSGAVYGVHVVYEMFGLRKSPFVIALHAAMAVGLGAFLLAVAATVHAAMVPSHTPFWRFRLALLVWPIVTAVPAFVVAVIAGVLLGRLAKAHAA